MLQLEHQQQQHQQLQQQQQQQQLQQQQQPQQQQPQQQQQQQQPPPPQQQQPQQPDCIVDPGGGTPGPSALQPANDTAFPGGPHRHGGYNPPQQSHHHSNTPLGLQANKEPPKHLPKNKPFQTEDPLGQVYPVGHEHLESHRKGEKVERVFGCSECDKAFTREEHLKRHAKSHTDEPVHTCEVIGCNKSYTRKERLTRHYKEEEEEEEE